MTRHRLSPHFTVEEFDCHDGQQVPELALPGLRTLCAQYLEPLRSRFGPVIVHSGYRPAPYNQRIGGARSSYHIYGLHGWRELAADVECRHKTVADWWAWMDRHQRGMAIPHGGLGFYPRGGFIHVDSRVYIARWDGP